jgi:hypothetical protein
MTAITKVTVVATNKILRAVESRAKFDSMGDSEDTSS